MISDATLLHCPIRGALKAKQRAADSLTFTEEKQRVDAIRYLLHRKYPKENFGVETTLFKIGHKGRNSFRTDFAIYDSAFEDIKGKQIEKRVDHIRLLAEIKRDNADTARSKATQVTAAMRLVPDLGTLGVYWDDIEQRFFFKTLSGTRECINQAPISKIPVWGDSVGAVHLTYADLDAATDLVRVFDELENALHVYVVDKVERYALIQQLLITKIHDENMHQFKKNAPLDVQDFSVEAVTDSVVMSRMNSALAKAATHYEQYLPKKIYKQFKCDAEAMRNITKILAPLNILGSRIHVIQAFYMKFAKSIYKWDLAQYFTPHEVIDFIVDVVHPQYGEHVKDPACGSADFLISAFRHSGNSTKSQNCVWGTDNSPQAVQISILNMVLNGDGRTQITQEDSLESYSLNSKRFQVVLCNPPFGTKIVEKRQEILNRFSMGHVWFRDASNRLVETDKVRSKQQTGILFAELCVRLAEPGGRVGIILPNGYLGNRSTEYLALREWLLRHARIVGIVAFPRFTFKKSGADVSASAVFLERRKKPLTSAIESVDYNFFVGLVESVGWRAGDKKAVPIYQRDPETGKVILDQLNEPILDSDFKAVLDEFLRSPATNCFPWLLDDRSVEGSQSWSVPIERVLRSNDLILDPKRLSFKANQVRISITNKIHFALGDVLEIVPDAKPEIDPSRVYHYVEIQRIGIGDYDYEPKRGWELPGRAKLLSKRGDLFVPHVWGCAGKWFMAGGDCSSLIVTNGCTRLRMKSGQADRLPDVVAGLCSEAFSVQMRSLATGSDGLADVIDNDLLTIVLPALSENTRTTIRKKLNLLLDGELRFGKTMVALTVNDQCYVDVQARKSHCSVV